MGEIIQKSAVLGIDAAWTVREPSGISLLVQTDTGWSSVGLAPSYEQFMALADGKVVNWDQAPKGSEPNLKMLVQVAQQMASPAKIRTIAVDMPLSIQKISGRRLQILQFPGRLAQKVALHIHQMSSGQAHWQISTGLRVTSLDSNWQLRAPLSEVSHH